MKKFLENTMVVVGILLIGWLVFSYIDVISHNMDDCDYSRYNAIVLFMDKLGE